jgi:photosystem II stability/assembly factor-like uncharacterized protein
MTPDERELRRALEARSGEVSPAFRARMSALPFGERRMSNALSLVALVAVAAMTVAVIGVLLVTRQVMAPGRHGGPASTSRVTSPSPTPILAPTTVQLSAPSGGVVWALVDDGLLFRSTDRGAHWEQRSLPPTSTSPMAAISFVDDLQGWLTTGGSPETDCNGEGTQIWHTTDGGLSWRQVAAVNGLEPDSSGIGYAQCKQGLWFVDSSHGFLGAWDGNHRPTIYRTSDGGLSWKGGTLPDPPGFVTQAGGFTLRVDLVKAFGGTLLATASGRQDGDVEDRIYIFSSEDGGTNWSYLAKLPNAAGTLAVVTATRWLLVVPGGPSLETTDAGASWRPYVSDYEQAAAVAPQIVFGDSLTGYATVRGGIQRTADGGAHWVTINTPGTLQPG